MGLHRSDPMGIARIALVGAAVVFVVVMIFIGAKGLFASFDAEGGAPTETPIEGGPTSVPRGEAPVAELAPTLIIKCLDTSCPVFVGIPAGDILREHSAPMSQGERFQSDEEMLNISFYAGQVEILANGKEYVPTAKEGTATQLTVERGKDPTPDPS